MFVRYEKNLDNTFFIFDLDNSKIYKGSEDAWIVYRELKRHKNLNFYLRQVVKSISDKNKISQIKKYIYTLWDKKVLILTKKEIEALREDD